MSKELTEYAKERLRALNSSDFATAITDEYAPDDEFIEMNRGKFVTVYINAGKKKGIRAKDIDECIETIKKKTPRPVSSANESVENVKMRLHMPF